MELGRLLGVTVLVCTVCWPTPDLGSRAMGLVLVGLGSVSRSSPILELQEAPCRA